MNNHTRGADPESALGDPAEDSRRSMDGPVVTHLNMDPNASDDTKRAVAEMLHAAYRYKPPHELDHGLTGTPQNP